jgi:hypothetical protein
MNSIEHHDAAKLANSANGDFGYITLHTGTTGNPAKKGMVIRWVWSLKYGTGVGADQYDWI